MSTSSNPPMAVLQERAFATSAAYSQGSAHLMHSHIRDGMVQHIRERVLDRLAATGSCHVLEVGAGHGGFTDHVVAAGATVTATEMSKPSLVLLGERFRYNSAVKLLYDPDGDVMFRREEAFDLVLCMSVLHHIPDYLAYVDQIIPLVKAGGAFVSFQDPLYYPRRSGMSLSADRAAFLAWRVFQGEVRRGAATQIRRWRGIYEADRPEDMVEYHVVRRGVDEEALMNVLGRRFEAVELLRYWSTPSVPLQKMGDRLGAVNTFGIVACNARGSFG